MVFVVWKGGFEEGWGDGVGVCVVGGWVWGGYEGTRV